VEVNGQLHVPVGTPRERIPATHQYRNSRGVLILPKFEILPCSQLRICTE